MVGALYSTFYRRIYFSDVGYSASKKVFSSYANKNLF
jgi:hypothetical protein